MFGNLGWGEIGLLLLLGLLIFGPDRLPKATADAAKLLRELREMARGAASELKSELGPEMADLDLRSLHPRRFVEGVFSDDEEGPTEPTPVGRPAYQPPLEPHERPPYDVDAT